MNSGEVVKTLLKAVGILALLGVAVSVIGAVMFFSSFGDRAPSEFVVENHTGQTLIVGPDAPGSGTPQRAKPGDDLWFTPRDDGCDSSPWVATTTSGEVLARIPGACADHRWTIRGPNDSTYQ